MATNAAYPATFTFDPPEKIANWRPLVAWLLAIPHFVVLYGLNLVSEVVAFLREEYPPFAFSTTPADPGDDPRARVDIMPQLTDRNRLTVAFRLILVIPQFIVIGVLGFVAFVVVVIAFFAVLFTGKWPVGLRDFVLGVMRWNLRVQAYFLMLNDVYPPFALG